MIETPVRDWLRGRPQLAHMATIDLAKDQPNRLTYPRVTVRRIVDPRTHDLDGETGARQVRVQLDVWTRKGQQAESIVDQIEEELPSMSGLNIGGRIVRDADVLNVFDGPVERPAEGKADSIDHLIVDVMLSIQSPLE